MYVSLTQKCLKRSSTMLKFLSLLFFLLRPDVISYLELVVGI